MDRIQPPVQWFGSLQTLYITLLHKKSAKRRRSREKFPGWTGYNLQSSGFIPCKPCKLHYYVRSLGQGGGAGRSCQGGLVQPPVQWFCSLQTLYITFLHKMTGTRRRSREKLPGWMWYNLQSSGFVSCCPASQVKKT
jgi:hypothetical protein